MTHVQAVFIRNLRFFRKNRGLSQLKFSEMISISPNYLNAVENGKNFPSLEVIQAISDRLEILPYQLFLEYPVDTPSLHEGKTAVQELVRLKQKIVEEIDSAIHKYEKPDAGA
jgi:transcriptional regulator with XRE-family HTH domain